MQQQIQGGPPGPMLQQTQGQGPSSASSVSKVNNDEMKEEPEGQDEASEMPCTINTFGFGTGHNDQLLKALAENGRGMYAYIESTDQISGTFAECLGGLVSIIGQDLKVQVQALNDVDTTA